MPVTHEPWLVALSLIVAIQGAYVGLSLAVQVGAAVSMRRRMLLARPYRSRVHRSHIVNLEHVVALKRAGDQGLVELSGPDRPKVPVSRSRLRSLKSRLGLAIGEVEGLTSPAGPPAG
jgi:DNA-binding LytR/AlgR family response regulator